MLTTLLASLLGASLLWLEVGGPPFRISPDGQYYLQDRPPRPYGMRWLLPTLLRSRVQWWIALSWGSIVLTALMVGMVGGWMASLLFLGLATTRTNVLFPILTDQVGMLLLTLGVVLPWPWNLLAVGLGALVNEKVPIFSAALTGNYWLLLPIVAAWVSYSRSPKPSDDSPPWLRQPFQEARKSLLLTPQALLLPWGLALPGLLSVPPLAVILAYLQLLTAQDRARLYQWIAPSVCLAAVPWIPEPWAVPILVLHWVNPWRSTL